MNPSISLPYRYKQKLMFHFIRELFDVEGNVLKSLWDKN